MFGFGKKVFKKVRRNIKKAVLVAALAAMVFGAKDAQTAINIENHLPPPVRAEITQTLERHPIQHNKSLAVSIHVKKAEKELNLVEHNLSSADNFIVGTGDSFNPRHVANFNNGVLNALENLEKAAFEYRDAAHILGDENTFKSEFNTIYETYHEIYKNYFNVKYEESIYYATHGNLSRALSVVTDMDKEFNIHLRTFSANFPDTSLQNLLKTTYGMTQELFREITSHRDGSPHAHSGSKANAPAPWWEHTPHQDHFGIHRIS